MPDTPAMRDPSAAAKIGAACGFVIALIGCGIDAYSRHGGAWAAQIRYQMDYTQRVPFFLAWLPPHARWYLMEDPWKWGGLAIITENTGLAILALSLTLWIFWQKDPA